MQQVFAKYAGSGRPEQVSRLTQRVKRLFGFLKLGQRGVSI